MHRYFTVFILIALALTGCGEKTSTDMNQRLNDGDYEDVILDVTKKLKELPDNTTLHALAAKGLFLKCVDENCFKTDTAPHVMSLVKNHLTFVTAPVALEDGSSLDVVADLTNILPTIMALPNQPYPLLAALDAFDDGSLKKNYTNAVFKQLLLAWRTEDKMAIQTLKHLTQTDKLNKTHIMFASLIDAWATDYKRAAGFIVALRSRQKDTVPAAAFKIVPRAYLKGSANKQAFLDSFLTTLYNTKLNTLFAQGYTHIADELMLMRPMLITAEDASATISENKEMALQLDKLILVLAPNHIEKWKTFLPKAQKYIAKTGDISLLVDHIDVAKLPKNVKITYNSVLFNLLETLAQKDINILPVLKLLQSTEPSAEQQASLNRIVQESLNLALAGDNMLMAIDLATFNPSVAQKMRQDLVKKTVDYIRAHFTKNDFDSIKTAVTFLKKTLKVDLNLEAVLLQEFSRYLKDENISDALSSDTIDTLLKPQKDIAYDLGPKFTFMKTHFKDKPEVIDNQLKSLVLAAKGTYGTATALWKIFHLFDDTLFPIKERHIYLVNTLQDNLSKNDDLTVKDIIEKGLALHNTHKDIALNFIINEAFNRSSTLEDYEVIWQKSGEKLKEIIKNTRPEFAALMTGISLYKNNKKGEAGKLFATITKKDYLGFAQKYIDYYLDVFKDYKGVYITENTDKNMPVGIIIVTPAPDGVHQMMSLKFTFINRVGTVHTTNENTLQHSFGNTYRSDIIAQVDFDNMSVPISEKDRTSIKLPRKFEEVFGLISNIKLTRNKGIPTLSISVKDSSKIYTFRHFTQYINEPLFPDGRYSITQQISKSDEHTDRVLPIGSLLKLATDPTPLQPIAGKRVFGIVYKVSGTLLHPGENKEQPVEGFFNPNRYTTNLLFSYPLGKGQGTVKAEMRCQALDGFLVCGAHNKHNDRRRHRHLVIGEQTAESLAEEKLIRAQRHKLIREEKERMRQAKEIELLKEQEALLEDILEPPTVNEHTSKTPDEATTPLKAPDGVEKK